MKHSLSRKGKVDVGSSKNTRSLPQASPPKKEVARLEGGT